MPIPALPDPPPHATIQRTVDADRLTLTAPPLGLWRGSFGMAIIGPLIVAVPLVILARAGQPLTTLDPWLVAWLIFLVLVGLTFAVIGTDLGTAHASLSTGPEGLTFQRRSRLRSTTRQIPVDQIESIAIIEAPVTAGNKPLLRLEVRTAEGKPVRTFAARPQRDLEWAKRCLETTLRQTTQSQ